MTKSLVAVVDAMAVRCDELATRIALLEESLEEVVQTFSEDLTAVRAAAESLAVHRVPAGGDGEPPETTADDNS
ncbi:MAG: hypothetical protein ACYCU7_02380 [Acidimicrobiales bacterium]